MILIKKDLLNVLNKVVLGLSNQTITPILNYICFKDNKVRAFNGIQGIEINYTSELNCLVHGVTFVNLINNINSELIEIKQTETHLIIKTANINSKIAILPVKDYPFIIEDNNKISINLTNDLVQGVKYCLSTVNTDPNQKNQFGITLTNECLFSTDMLRISQYKLQEKLELPEDFRILLPQTFCNLLLKFIDISACKLVFNTNNIVAEFEEIKISTQLISGFNFINYGKTIDKILENKYEFIPITDEFMNAVDRCNNILKSSKKETALLQFYFNEIGLKLTTETMLDYINTGSICLYEESVDMKVKSIPKFRVKAGLLVKLKDYIEFIGFIPMSNKVMIIGKKGNYTQLISSLVI